MRTERLISPQTASRLPAPAPVILRDGSTAWLRPARPDDVAKLEALFQRASRESVWLRFFTAAVRISQRELARMVDIDGVSRMTYVVTRGEAAEEQIIAIGNYVRLPRWDTAEVAFFVDDAYHGKGLGTVLLERLAEHAKQQRILTIVATVRPENQPMLDVFRKGGFEPHIAWDEGVMRVELPATPSEQARAQAEARERLATAASLEPFFRPQSIAVIGASRQADALGRQVFEQIIRTGFSGPVYPINPYARAIAAVRAFPSILDVPDEVDLAILVVPAEQIHPLVETCAKKRVRAVLVLSAGFAETGETGLARQEELVHTIRAQGMRLIGPNCIGLLNTDPAVRLNTIANPGHPRRGGVAISTQSGALGLAVLDYIHASGLGVSMFVNVGNKADVSGNDLLQYWETDPATELILLYLESFGNPRKFARLARRVTRHKPIVAIKSGRSRVSASGVQAAAAQVSGSDYSAYATDALFRQAGIIRAETLEESLEIATILTLQPLPQGNRVAIVTNAKGLGVLCADACSAHGLVLAGNAGDEENEPDNPLALPINARPEDYAAAVQQDIDRASVDAVIVICVPTGSITEQELSQLLSQAGQQNGGLKPILSCFLPQYGVPPGQTPDAGANQAAKTLLPLFRFPESAARALAHAATYSAWKRRPLSAVPVPTDVDAEAARRILDTAGPGWLQPQETRALLAAAGLHLSDSVQRAGPNEVIVRVVEDPNFGPLIGFGVSGAAAEFLQDRALCITPLTSADAQELVHSIRGLPLLASDHGQPASDLDAIVEVLLRVSWLVEECPEIIQLELQPISVFAAGHGVILHQGRISVRS